ncbi:molybdenum ABC transporter permease subunit [Adhaeribacter aerolatus]|uniref:Molybdenum transport system permease n=1 Tax=Adhaeribacter aerolatus TaxID=670289 RepID=A0A512AYU2_9BACT|nr:molybdate ABC transporter permease subunit [Adhaeribacter aerolatus]GEO04870.1 molybdenum ABC transporter permease subunit [Adhaeribacter aerolatus]
MNLDWQPLWLTFKLAGITTFLLLLLGLPLAWWLAHTRSRVKPIVEAIISLPIVLPPSVMGFYLLLAFSPTGFPGSFFSDVLNVPLVFSFTGLVVGSVIYSLPFMVQPLQAGLESLPNSLTEASYTLGRSKTETLFRVLLPNIRPALLTGTVLSFAHTIGEFGLVLMIGGNIPGETRVVSIAIYHEVESLNYGSAHVYSLVLLVLSFLILLTVYLVNKRLVKTL